VSSAALPNGIAAICLAMRDEFGLIPHVFFDWAEGSPLVHFLRFILRGSGEVAPVTREIRELQPCRYWLTVPGEGRWEGDQTAVRGPR
jgi:hypothetical protein